MASAIHQHESAIGILMSPPSRIPLPHPSPLLPSGCHKALVFGFLCHITPTGYLLYTWQCVCFNAILSNHPTLSFSYCVQRSIFVHLCLLCCPACRIISTIILGSIHVLIYDICLSLSDLTSLYIKGSRFTHLIRTDSNKFLFIVE